MKKMDVFDAAKAGNLIQLKQCLSEGTHINSRDKGGCTALYRAARFNSIHIVEYLLKNKADTEIRQNKDQRTALIVASSNNNIEIVKLLVRNQARVNVQDISGFTALYHAAKNGHEAVVSVLLQFEADTEIRTHEGKWTAVRAAAYCNHGGVVELLLTHRAQVDSQDIGGQTPLWGAAFDGQKDTVATLLKFKPKVDLCCTKGLSPLYVAAQHGYKEVIAMLLDAGAQIDQADQDGFTPLIIACYKNQSAVVELLCRRKAGVNLTDKWGNTVLHHAVKENAVDVMKMLLKRKPQLTKNNPGKTALDIAKDKKYDRIVTVIEEYRASQESNEVDRPRSGMKDYASVMYSELKDKKNALNAQRGTTLDSNYKVLEKKLNTILERIERLESKISVEGERGTTTLWKELSDIRGEINQLPVTANPNKDLGNTHLAHIAKSLGADWKLLGAFLGLAHQEIKSISADNPNDSVYSSWVMLTYWRDGNTKRVDVKKELLKEGMINVNRRDVLVMI